MEIRRPKSMIVEVPDERVEGFRDDQTGVVQDEWVHNMLGGELMCELVKEGSSR